MKVLTQKNTLVTNEAVLISACFDAWIITQDIFSNIASHWFDIDLHWMLNTNNVFLDPLDTKMKSTLAIILGLLLVSCTSNPDDYTTVYVSPHKYKDYSCEEIAVDMRGIGKKLGISYSEAQSERNKDVAIATVGTVLFWPAFLFLDGDELDLSRFGHLKSEMEALTTAAELKNCNIEVISVI